MILVFLLVVFGILGVTFFKGKFSYCDTKNIPKIKIKQIYTMWECFDYGGEWVNPNPNFDNIFNAILTLFTMITTEGWNWLMWRALDSTNINQVPSTNNSLSLWIFFIIFMVIGSVFILNLFVGVVIGAFNVEKEFLARNN